VSSTTLPVVEGHEQKYHEQISLAPQECHALACLSSRANCGCAAMRQVTFVTSPTFLLVLKSQYELQERVRAWKALASTVGTLRTLRGVRVTEMKSVAKLLSTCVLSAVLASCGATKQTTTAPPLTATPWVITITGGGGTAPLIYLNVTTTLTPAATCNSPAGNVSSAVCLTGTSPFNSVPGFFAPAGTPESILVGVNAGTDPTGAGQGFNILYVYSTASAGAWNIVGEGVFYPNGNVAGTWQCSTTSACDGLTGKFFAFPCGPGELCDTPNGT
jgi:hypothetical protein